MPKKNDLVLVDEKYLESKIYIIRGQKVMLDKDLAEIYGYATKRFNEQVQRNIEKFKSKDFMFKLTQEEAKSLRSQFATLNNDGFFNSLKSEELISNKSNNKRGMHYKYLPYVFTESGIYMLMTVLKGPLATKQSIALIRLFRSMKDYLMENKELISNKELELRTQLLEKDVKEIKDDNKVIKMDLKKVMDNFIDPSTYKHFLILDGKKFEADIAYKNIFKQAKKSIIYIDNYIGLKTLELLSYARNNASITIISDNKAKPPLSQNIVNDFIQQNKSNKITLLEAKRNHDRYIIIDYDTKNEIIYHCGASLKDAGNKITTIQKIEDPFIYNKTIKELLKNNYLKI